VLEEALSEKVKVKKGDKTRWRTSLEAIVLRIVTDALNRDPKALAALMAMMRSVGMTGEAPEVNNLEAFTADDAALIADFLQRQSTPSEQPDAQEENWGSTVGAARPGKRAAS
jgi:hypothetical protein